MSLWTKVRDAVESVASVAGNYYLPGSGIVTSRMVSKGSQKELGSTIGQAAMLGSGIAGGVAGNMSNYGTLVSQVLGKISPQTAQLVGDSGAPTTSGAGAVAPGAQDTAVDTSAASSAAKSAGISPNAVDALSAPPASASVETPSANNVLDHTIADATPPINGQSTGGNSLVDRTLNWVKGNPMPAAAVGLGGMQIIGGAMQGVGARAGKLEEIQAQEQANVQLLKDRQAAAGAGGYYGTPGVSAPANTRVIRRPNGSLVYAPNGLIASQVA